MKQVDVLPRYLSREKANWEELGELDPFWAVLSGPDVQFGKWNLERFFETGRCEIDQTMTIARDLGYPRGHTRVLDFGCGPGRLTRALASHFDEALGVDISETMIHRAKALHEGFPQCRFFINARSDLSIFPDQYFDMVYCDIVLQHVPNRSQIFDYIREFVRTLRPTGLIVFQLLSFLPVRYRLQPRRRLYVLMRSLRISHKFLYEKLRLSPIRNGFVPESNVVQELEATGAVVLQVRRNEVDGGIRNCRYFVTRYT